MSKINTINILIKQRKLLYIDYMEQQNQCELNNEIWAIIGFKGVYAMNLTYKQALQKIDFVNDTGKTIVTNETAEKELSLFEEKLLRGNITEYPSGLDNKLNK